MSVFSGAAERVIKAEPKPEKEKTEVTVEEPTAEEVVEEKPKKRGRRA